MNTQKTSELVIQNMLKVSSKLLSDTKQDVFDQINKVLDCKGAEYSSEDNRIENFLAGARMDNETPERALWGMMKKHVLSVIKFIEEVEAGRQRRPLEMWQEKFVDIHNYLILLEAMTKARAHVEAELLKQAKKEAME